MNEQRGNVPQHEGTNRLGQEIKQRLFNLHQREHGDAMEEEYLAQQEQAEQRARFVALFDPCGVE